MFCTASSTSAARNAASLRARLATVSRKLRVSGILNPPSASELVPVSRSWRRGRSSLPAPVFRPQCLGEGDIVVLRPLVPAQQKHHQIRSIESEIDPIAWAIIDAGFLHALPDRPYIWPQAPHQFSDRRVYSCRGPRVA